MARKYRIIPTKCGNWLHVQGRFFWFFWRKLDHKPFISSIDEAKDFIDETVEEITGKFKNMEPLYYDENGH